MRGSAGLSHCLGFLPLLCNFLRGITTCSLVRCPSLLPLTYTPKLFTRLQFQGVLVRGSQDREACERAAWHWTRNKLSVAVCLAVSRDVSYWHDGWCIFRRQERVTAVDQLYVRLESRQNRAGKEERSLTQSSVKLLY